MDAQFEHEGVREVIVPGEVVPDGDLAHSYDLPLSEEDVAEFEQEMDRIRAAERDGWIEGRNIIIR